VPVEGALSLRRHLIAPAPREYAYHSLRTRVPRAARQNSGLLAAAEAYRLVPHEVTEVLKAR
jgi:hypothetical protein